MDSGILTPLACSIVRFLTGPHPELRPSSKVDSLKYYVLLRRGRFDLAPQIQFRISKVDSVSMACGASG
jgi:hypothetical protein